MKNSIFKKARIKQTDFDHSVRTFEKYAETPFEKLLILGAGEMNHEKTIDANYILAVEWADERLDALNKLPNVMPLKYDIAHVTKLFPNNAFDAVLLFDVLEHLTKNQALNLIKDLKRIIRKQILVFIPIQPEIEDLDALIELQRNNKDKNLPLGSHLSTWTVNELESLGFHGEYSPNYHKHLGWGAIVCTMSLN